MTAPEHDDARLEELLGAYALDACEPEEAAELEALLAQRPGLAREAAQLTDAAVWIGAAGALQAPPTLRTTIFERARRRAGGTADPAARLYADETDRLARELDLLDPDDDHVRTPNGLSARELVVHLAAQESLLARAIGHPVEADVDLLDTEGRTAASIEWFEDRPYEEIIDLWRRSVRAVQTWADDPATHHIDVDWLGLALRRDSVLIARSFENWIHRDDLRRARNRPSSPPSPAELHLMADLALHTLPSGLMLADRAHTGRSARVVLSGDGGGEWLVPFALGTVVPDAAPDVTLTVNVVDWCLLAGERLDPVDLDRTVDGDPRLADDLVAAAPAFSTL